MIVLKVVEQETSDDVPDNILDAIRRMVRNRA